MNTRKFDAIIPVIMICTVAASGAYFLIEWQEENLLTEEEAMLKMAENLNALSTDRTNCAELESATATHPIMKKAIADKMEELDC